MKKRRVNSWREGGVFTHNNMKHGLREPELCDNLALHSEGLISRDIYPSGS